ncbi:MAG TPA: P-loop NTPase [Caldilineae bacterium]|nr:P-loop NTPase [Caldilineae bacterium]
MIITVASGKGGTGKTTVAVNLGLALAREGQLPVHIIDCDVEEPNAALFLHPTLKESEEVGQLIPEVNLDLCTFCGRCAEVCQYSAIAVVAQRVLVFPELCHGCGSCALNCPEGAISEKLDVMGVLEIGHAGPIAFAQGRMNVGEAMAVPIIRQLKRRAIPEDHDGRVIILDAPPGTSCPVVESMRGSDYVLMVTEPTPFGLHDLRLAVQVARNELGLPVGVVINREGIGDEGVDAYCEEEGIPILMRIPLDRRIAEAYSEGIPMVEVLPEYREAFLALYREIAQRVGMEVTP